MADCVHCGDSHAPGAPGCPGSRIGTTVAGKYKVTAILGMGGMGAVYDAEHVGLRRRVALKMLHRQFADDKELNARFVREARESAALHHPGIIAVHDTGVTEDGAAYIEMERLDGVDLHKAIKLAGPFDVNRALRVASELLDAVAATHARGVIHRDLKSPNVFLARTADGGEQVKLLDFGFAKPAEDDLHLTQPDQILGSPLYMSPEQYRDPTQVDVRTDLYSVGVILYEMLTATWPVTFADKKELLRKVLRGDLSRNPATSRPDTPAWLDALVARAMAFDRAERFATAAEMQAALAARDTAPPAPPPPAPGTGLGLDAPARWKPSWFRRIFGSGGGGGSGSGKR